MSWSAAAETWRPVAEDPRYEVSDLGRVRRVGKSAPLVPCRQKKLPGDGEGYFKVKLGRTRQRYVHTLVCTAFHGPRPAGMTVDHRDNDVTNNVAENLRWLRAPLNCARHDPEPPEGWRPITPQEAEAIHAELEAAGW